MTGWDQGDLRILAERKRRILVRLKVISDGSTGMPAHEGQAQVVRTRSPIFADDPKAPLKRALKAGDRVRSTRTSESKVPAGARLADEHEIPDRERSLYDHYIARFALAQGDPDRITTLVTLAERDYREHVQGNRRAHNEDSTSRDKRILHEWRGWPPDDVAVHERMGRGGSGAVRKLRRLSELDPETGYPEELSEREREMLRMVRAGDAFRTVASATGCSPTTVMRFVAADLPRLAA